jgi:hypothetical protein
MDADPGTSTGGAGGGTVLAGMEPVITTPTRRQSSTVGSTSTNTGSISNAVFTQDKADNGQEQRVGTGLPPQEIVQPLPIVEEPTLELLLRQLQRRVALAAEGRGTAAASPIDLKLQDDVEEATRKIKEAMELTRPRG